MVMLRVCSFESRRGPEIASLFQRLGCEVFVAPSMRERPLKENPAVAEFCQLLYAGKLDMVIFLTGVGARHLLEAVEHYSSREQFFAALKNVVTVVRGPKPTVVLREWGIQIDHRAPEPNTWRELLATLDAEAPVNGKRLAIQEYGKSNPALMTALEERGAWVMPVPVYRWDLPEDCGPLETAIHRTIAGEFDVLAFTSAQQVHHVLEVAERLGLRESWFQAAKQCVIASIGPTASETLTDLGFPVDIEPVHPKMGPLAKETAELAPGLLAKARART
ncbi:MAG: uroporphyrinogen-III synthase [Planctomycetaceae bacterium]|nr:uroporphyrinogen-III synthase [Planctomycetaceae bacterium]